MEVNMNSDYTEYYIGVGLKENEILKIREGAYYTVYGVFGRYIDQNAEVIAKSAGNVVRTSMGGFEYKETLANLAELVCAIGICGLRKLLQRSDANIANKFIIQLLRYCKDDISQYSNIVVDSSVEGVLTALNLSGNQARNIYVNSSITSLEQLPYVKFEKEAREGSGYMLYFMERSFGIECRQQRKLNESFEFLNLDSDIWKKYEEYYIKDAVQKMTEQQIAKYIFENIKSDNKHLNPLYVKRTLRKMGNYYPAGVDNAGKKILDITNKTLDKFMETDEMSSANIIAEASGLLYDGRKEKGILLDNMMELIQKLLYDVTGMGGNDFSRNKINERTKEQVHLVHS